MFTLSIMSAVQDALRTTMLDICSVIYRLIAFCFEVFYNLGTANLLQNEAVQNIISRTTLIIGLFMVFRVTFAFIQYIIDPDAMTDKSKGAGAIVKKIVIAIVLLGSTSFLFRFAFKVQDTVLDSHVLEKVFFGNNEIDTESFGGRLSSTIFTTFYRIKPNPSNSANKNYSDCKDLVENYLEEDIANNKGSVSLAYSCLLKRADFPAENDLAEEIASNGEKEDKTSYVIDFDGGGVLALLVGVAVLYVGFMFTFQVGVRLLQLAYLQIIAPIPIAMYITPKGEENLKKWGQQCLVTFLDFFLRVAIIYFAICIIEIIRDNNTILSIYGEGTIYNTYVTCVMIIATLLFAKKIPNLLKEIFPGLGGAAGFSYDISGKAFKETMKLGYNATPIGWGLKGAKSLGSAIDRKVHGKSFFGSGKIMQAIDKWLPEQAEIRKNRHEQDDRRKLYDEGRNIYNEFNGEIKDENGKLKERKELLKVPKLGKVAYEQCAGFIRIPDGKNPLENTAVHPESYEQTEKLLELLGFKIEDLKNKENLNSLREKLKSVNIEETAKTLDIGEMTLADIISELSKPGRDPREDMPKPVLRSDVLKFEDLTEGMVLTGTVRNVIDFGAFVDIGVKYDGLVHISEMSDSYVKSPSEIVSVGDIVKVKVIKIDQERKKVGLSMKIS